MSKYIYWVKKRLVWVFLDIEEIREKYNETGLKEGGGIEMSTTVLSIYAMHALFALNILTMVIHPYIVLMCIFTVKTTKQYEVTAAQKCRHVAFACRWSSTTATLHNGPGKFARRHIRTYR